MMAPWKPLHTRPTVPDLPVDKPEPIDGDKDDRNYCRERSIEIIEELIELLDDLKHDGRNRGTQQGLLFLMEYFRREMED